MQKTESLPVLTYATGGGWSVHGYARDAQSARRMIKRKLLTDSEKSLINNHGFDLLVFRRSDVIREINGGPEGFVYSVGKTVKS